MKKTRQQTIPVLIDIKYAHHQNKFDETFGDGVSYADIEQRSYLEFKDMVFNKISKDIKFRKFCRDNGALTIKVDMVQEEYDLFLEIHENGKKPKNKTLDKFEFVFEFEVSAVKIMGKSDLIRNKKTQLTDEEYKFLEENEEDEFGEENEEDEEIE